MKQNGSCNSSMGESCPHRIGECYNHVIYSAHIDENNERWWRCEFETAYDQSVQEDEWDECLVEQKFTYSNKLCAWIQRMIDEKKPFDQWDGILKAYICACSNGLIPVKAEVE